MTRIEADRDENPMMQPRIRILKTTAVFSSCLAVIVYLLWILGVPALPVTDAMQQLVAVPRWEYWLLQASAPSSLAWHWTGGFNPVEIADRVPVILLAVSWLSLSWVTGSAILRWDAVASKLGIWQKRCLAILVGHVFSAGTYFAFGSCFWTQSPWLFLICILGFVLLLRISYSSKPSPDLRSERNADRAKQGDNQAVDRVVTDLSYSNSTFRRLIGLLWLGIVWLASIQIYGATVPTVDQEIRTTDWWLIHHAFQEDRIRFYPENWDANAPAGSSMPGLFSASLFRSVLMNDSLLQDGSISSRQILYQTGLTGALASKVVNSGLCVISAAFLGLFIRRRFGLLPCCVCVFLLLATPGIAELARFGRTEALLGGQCVVLIIFWAYTQQANYEQVDGVVGVRHSPCWWFLVAGAFLNGYGSALIVGLPSVFLLLMEGMRKNCCEVLPVVGASLPKKQGALLKACLLVVAISIGVFPYTRNALACGDPFAPWTFVALDSLGMPIADQDTSLWKIRYQVPSQTTSEIRAIQQGLAGMPEEVLVTPSRSPYRFENMLDAWNRLTWDSNAHGLLLIPLACIGMLVGRFGMQTLDFKRKQSDAPNLSSTGPAVDRVLMATVVWAVAWILAWWFFSRRLDRDWVGLLFLMSYPAAGCVRWMMDRCWPVMLGGFVIITLVWSVVVIPTWPTSDNRILMSLKSLTMQGQPQLGVDPTNVVSALNGLIAQQAQIDSTANLLLIGSKDDFGILCDCVSFSLFDQDFQNDSTSESMETWLDGLRARKVTHVVFLWPEIADFDKTYGREREVEYRQKLGQAMSLGSLEPIDLELNSSVAQLFRVTAQ